MKTLSFGDFSIEIDLDEKGEAYLIAMIKEDIIMARRDFKYRIEHPQIPPILIETQEEGNYPKEKKKSKNGKVKNGR